MRTSQITRDKGQGYKFMTKFSSGIFTAVDICAQTVGRGTISTINGSCHSRELTKDTFNLPPSFPLTRSLPGVCSPEMGRCPRAATLRRPARKQAYKSRSHSNAPRRHVVVA